MVEVSKIQEAFSGLIGYKNPLNPEFAIVDAENQLSESGLFVTDNPYAKIEYIKSSQDYLDITDIQFNDLLRDINKVAVADVCSKVFNKFDYIDRNVIYKYAYSMDETNSLPVGFVGYRIRVEPQKSIAFKITRAFCDFSGAGSIELILWSSHKKAALKTRHIVLTHEHQEVNLDWTLNDTDGIYKGEYFIGYINAGMLPYKRNYENANYISNITYLDIDPIVVEGHNTVELFNIKDVDYNNDLYNGINLDITVYDDFTDLIAQNKFLFSRAVYLQCVINVLQSYLSSLRSNRNENIAAELYQKIKLEIEGSDSKESPIAIKGLRPQLLGEISQIQNELSKLQKGYFGDGIQVITQY